MEGAYEQVQSVTGLKLDLATLGPKVRVYGSDAISVSTYGEDIRNGSQRTRSGAEPTIL
jgi:hypothetical protein